MPIVDIGVVKTIRDFLPGDGMAVALIVELFRPGIDLRGIAGNGAAIRGSEPGSVLAGQHIVQSVMGIVAQRQIVSAFTEDVTLGTVAVVGGQEVLVHFQLTGLGGTRGEQLCFIKGHQLYGGLFHQIGLLVVAVGGLGIQLDDRLAGRVAGVGDGHGCQELAVCFLHLVQFLGKGGVAETIAKGIDYLIGVIPSVGGSPHASLGDGVALPQNRVLIAGLVVTVAHIDIFSVHHIVTAVGVRDIPEVHHGRGRHGAGGIGIRQAAGRIGCAGEQVSNTAEAAAVARTADPHAGVHTVSIQPVNLHGIAGVQQNDDLLEAAAVLVLFHQSHHVALIGGELQHTNDGAIAVLVIRQ